MFEVFVQGCVNANTDVIHLDSERNSDVCVRLLRIILVDFVAGVDCVIVAACVGHGIYDLARKTHVHVADRDTHRQIRFWHKDTHVTFAPEVLHAPPAPRAPFVPL